VLVVIECSDAPDDRLARVMVLVVKCTGEADGDTPPEPPAVRTLNVDDADRRLERAVTADEVEEYVLAVLYVAFSNVEFVLMLDVGRDDTVDLREGAPCRPGEGRSELGPGAFRSVDVVERIDDAEDFARRDCEDPVASLGKVLVRDIALPLRRTVRDALLPTDGGITILLISVFFTDNVEFASEFGSESFTSSSTRPCPSTWIFSGSRAVSSVSSFTLFSSEGSSSFSGSTIAGFRTGDGVLEFINREASEVGVNFESGRGSGLDTFLRLTLEEALSVLLTLPAIVLRRTLLVAVENVLRAL